MIDTQTVLLTLEGWRRLQDELTELRERRAAAESAIREESDPGDFLFEMADVDRQIDDLEYVLQRAIPVEPDELAPGTVGVGSRVTVCWGDGEEETYTLVGPPEISPRTGHISYESPVGRALMGRSAGERITVPVAPVPAHLDVVNVA